MDATISACVPYVILNPRTGVHDRLGVKAVEGRRDDQRGR